VKKTEKETGRKRSGEKREGETGIDLTHVSIT
jgi:hypothetical protein